MTTSIYSYQKVSDAWTTHVAQLPLDAETGEPLGQELATIGTTTYVAIPDGAVLPLQEDGIVLEPVELTDELRDQIKAASWQCRRIDEQVQDKIRARYALDEELYLSRIATGALMQIYQFEPGEQDELMAYAAYVESARQWGRDERAKLGL